MDAPEDTTGRLQKKHKSAGECQVADDCPTWPFSYLTAPAPIAI